MTKKKSKELGKYSNLEMNLYRARRIAADIEDEKLTPKDRDFLIQALRKIGQGEDPSEVFGVKAKRGEKKSLKSRQAADRVIFVLPWISSVITPYPEGHGLSLDEALSQAAEEFGFSEDTLRTYWFDYPEFRGPIFNPPISSLPIRRGK